MFIALKLHLILRWTTNTVKAESTETLTEETLLKKDLRKTINTNMFTISYLQIHILGFSNEGQIV